MLGRLLVDQPVEAGSRVAILVNGLGATPLKKLLILYGHARDWLRTRGITVAQPLVGNYVTSMEMAGASISLHVPDAELGRVLLAPAPCPFWKV